MKTGKGRRSALRKGRFSAPNNAYFITKCIYDRKQALLSKPACAEILIQAFLYGREQGWYRMLGFVIMPDHYHLIIALGQTKSLKQVMSSINKFAARRINIALKRSGRFWEEGFYDHQIRDRRDFDSILEYVHNNPVTAGLVQTPQDWPYSTANERFAHLIDWEWLGPSLKEVVPAKHRFSPKKIPYRYR